MAGHANQNGQGSSRDLTILYCTYNTELLGHKTGGLRLTNPIFLRPMYTATL